MSSGNKGFYIVDQMDTRKPGPLLAKPAVPHEQLIERCICDVRNTKPPAQIYTTHLETTGVGRDTVLLYNVISTLFNFTD